MCYCSGGNGVLGLVRTWYSLGGNLVLLWLALVLLKWQLVLLWWELVLLPGGSRCRRQSSPYSLHTAAAAAAGCYGEGGSA